MTVRRTRLYRVQYDLGSLRLYREDLRAIATAAAEAGDLAITCDGLEATSPDDFGDALPEKPRTMTISAGNRDTLSAVEIRLSAREATVLLTEPDTLLAGIVYRVRLICEPRRRRLRSALRVGRRDSWARIVSAALGIVLAVLASVVAVLAAVQASVAPQPGHHATGLSADIIALIASLGAVVLAALSFTVWAGNRPWVEIINAPRADRPTYWQRTGDMWLVGVITALLGAIAGYLLGRFG
jgi:hypothetical protein